MSGEGRYNRFRGEASSSSSSTNSSGGNSRPEERNVKAIVANHYNQIPEVGIEARKETRIYHMRNFNNWIKSMIIG